MNCPSYGRASDGATDNCADCGTPLMALRHGTTLANRYEILAVLGQGGMGIVYKARGKELDEIVALKVLRADVASAEIARRFRTEIKLARKVRHKNVCGIHEYGQDAATRFIVMEFIEGVDFRKIIRSRHLDTGEAFDVALQVAEGLQAIHEAGVVHRDLKTPNLMRDARGIVRLMDFGIAKLAESQDLTAATQTGMIAGTPEYMSPEQVRGQRVDARSDIYSLAIVLFGLFTGDLPFRGDTPVATILKHIQEAPPLTGSKAARLPRALVPVIEKALAKSPDERFASARELGLAIDRARRLTPTTGKTWTEPETQPGTLLLGEVDAEGVTRTQGVAVPPLTQTQPGVTLKLRRPINRPPLAGARSRRAPPPATHWQAPLSALSLAVIAVTLGGTWWYTRSGPADRAALPSTWVSTTPSTVEAAAPSAPPAVGSEAAGPEQVVVATPVSRLPTPHRPLPQKRAHTIAH
jgi:serine/threonine-protein kinase